MEPGPTHAQLHAGGPREGCQLHRLLLRRVRCPSRAHGCRVQGASSMAGIEPSAWVQGPSSMGRMGAGSLLNGAHGCRVPPQWGAWVQGASSMGRMGAGSLLNGAHGCRVPPQWRARVEAQRLLPLCMLWGRLRACMRARLCISVCLRACMRIPVYLCPRRCVCMCVCVRVLMVPCTEHIYSGCKKWVVHTHSALSPPSVAAGPGALPVRHGCAKAGRSVRASASLSCAWKPKHCLLHAAAVARYWPGL